MSNKIIDLNEYEQQEIVFRFHDKDYVMKNDLKEALKVMNAMAGKEVGIEDLDIIDKVIEAAVSNYDDELRSMAIAGKNKMFLHILSNASGMSVEELEKTIANPIQGNTK